MTLVGLISAPGNPDLPQPCVLAMEVGWTGKTGIYRGLP